jgi:hypothetical protein
MTACVARGRAIGTTVTGASVTGGKRTGGSVTGANVTGADVTGAKVTGGEVPAMGVAGTCVTVTNVPGTGTNELVSSTIPPEAFCEMFRPTKMLSALGGEVGRVPAGCTVTVAATVVLTLTVAFVPVVKLGELVASGAGGTLSVVVTEPLAFVPASMPTTDCNLRRRLTA